MTKTLTPNRYGFVLLINPQNLPIPDFTVKDMRNQNYGAVCVSKGMDTIVSASKGLRIYRPRELERILEDVNRSFRTETCCAIAVRGVRIQKISCIAVVEFSKHHIKHTGTCRESCGENSRAGDSNLTTTTSQSIYHHQIENFASTEEKNSNDLCTENGKSKFTRCSVAYRVLGTRL